MQFQGNRGKEAWGKEGSQAYFPMHQPMGSLFLDSVCSQTGEKGEAIFTFTSNLARLLN